MPSHAFREGSALIACTIFLVIFTTLAVGMATRGALQFPQNPTLTGAVENWEADIYVESANDIMAVQVGGNCNFDGDIDIVF